MNEEQMKQAVARFETLLKEQNERNERIKAEKEFKDFRKDRKSVV